MIIIKLMGGLGNQLQQYSLYRRLIENGIEAKLDISWFEADRQTAMYAPRKIEIEYIDGVNFDTATKEEVSSLTGGDNLFGKVRRKILPGTVSVCDERGRMYLSDLMDGIFVNRSVKDIYLEGYFACEKYHKDILPVLRNELRFSLEDISYSEELDKITYDMKKGNSVSLHLRRGDYLDPVNDKMFGGICTDEYYFAAITYVINHVSDPKFYFFSDDIDFAQKFNQDLAYKIPGINVDIVDINHGEKSYLDIYLMSNCRHNITANSTFSFWGARLNHYVDKLMIRPTIHRNDQIFDEKQMKSLWEGWKFVSPDGKVY